ncbi:MAG: hypothetical protein WCI95_06085 [bacterium]
MNKKIYFAAVVGAVMQLVPGSNEIVRGQGVDALLQGVMQSMGSSKEDKSMRESNQYRDSRDEGHWSDRDHRRDDYRPRDDDRRYPRNRSSDPDQIVRRAYEDILNREPDQEGLRVYRSKIIDDKWSEQDVRNALRKSPEEAKQNAAEVEAIIRRDYQDILGRDPDQAGLATYRQKMMQDGWSERDVRSDLKKSAERREQGGMTTEQAQQIIRRAYLSTLGREPDGGSSVYIEKVKHDHWDEGDVSKELRKSPEYRQKHKK